MSLTLPEDVAWVLNLLGFMWPEADEDKLRACAQAWRDFGAESVRINQDARLVAAQVAAENRGDSIDSFERYWQGVGGGGGDFERAKQAADHMAMALDGMATLVEGVKIAILAQLTLLAGEIVADQLLAVETLGVSEGAAAGEVIATRLIVRRIIQEVIHRIEREVVQQLKGHVVELFRRILATAVRRAVVGATVAGGTDLAKQEVDIYVFHSRTHVDLTELAGATGTGLVLGAVLPGARKHSTVERPPYRYTLGGQRSARSVEGWLVLDRSQGRNNAAQLSAGGKDRLKTDVGGHLIGRRFKGPTDDFNHFAQDNNFNNGKYKALENKWQRSMDAGQKVYVKITPTFPEGSERPSHLHIVYRIDGQTARITLPNGPQ